MYSSKIISKKIFIKNKIKTPKFFSLKKKYDKKKVIRYLNSKKVKLPIVLKPTNEGSSLGVEICKDKKKMFKKIDILIKRYSEIILEESNHTGVNVLSIVKKSFMVLLIKILNYQYVLLRLQVLHIVKLRMEYWKF